MASSQVAAFISHNAVCSSSHALHIQYMTWCPKAAPEGAHTESMFSQIRIDAQDSL